MAEFVFPEKRFVEAGGSSHEVAQMRREFSASDLTIQRAQAEFWLPLSVNGLRDYLTRRREDGYFTSTPESSESALDDAESAPIDKIAVSDTKSDSDDTGDSDATLD